MNNENYTVDYFIAKFEAIPDEQWIAGMLAGSHGRRCALGHCAPNYHGPRWQSIEGLALERLIDPNSPAISGVRKPRAACVNDGEDARYQQPTPKLRILAALRDIQRQQEEAAEELTNLRQCGVESRHAELAEVGRHDGDTAAITSQPIPARSAPHCASRDCVRPLPQSPSQPVACVHLWCGGQCLYCCALEPVKQKELA